MHRRRASGVLLAEYSDGSRACTFARGQIDLAQVSIHRVAFVRLHSGVSLQEVVLPFLGDGISGDVQSESADQAGAEKLEEFHQVLSNRPERECQWFSAFISAFEGAPVTSA